MDRTVKVSSLVWFGLGSVVTLLATLMVFQPWSVDAAPGDDDTTFVPITPCRLVDTREPSAAPLSPQESRAIETHGTNGPIEDSQCTIPTEAVALSMNVTSVNATEPTFWTFWADGTDQPTASSLNPTPGQPPIPNAVTSPISADGGLRVFNLAGTVDLVIDVNGYYTKSSLQQAFSNFQVSSATSRTSTTTWGQMLNVFGVGSGTDQLVIATFEIDEPNDNVEVECGLTPSGSSGPPTSSRRWVWESPDQGDITPVTITAHFIGNNSGSGAALWCRNESGTSAIRNIQLSVIANNQ